MQDKQVNLTNCDTEPIRIPGAIQSHGFLVVVDRVFTIRYCSENISRLLQVSAEHLLDAPLAMLEDLLVKAANNYFLKNLLQLGIRNGSFDKTNPFTIDINGKSFYIIISFSDNLFLIEFEPVVNSGNLDLQKIVGSSLTQMLADKELHSMLDHSAMQVKEIIGYDRVMVYRFAEDGHGEVISEARNEQFETWLGLHFPASDIPVQARELYKINITRQIADVYNVTSGIVSGSGETAQKIDLTHSQLRAVSPVHIQYLKNMGVASSFSISLMYKNELWGLIACHNYTPLIIDYKYREAAKLIGQVLSSALEFRQDEKNQYHQDLLNKNAGILTKQLGENTSIENALMSQPVNLLRVTSADGVLLQYDNKLIRKGRTPSPVEITGLLKWIQDVITERVFHTTCLSDHYPPAAAFASVGSGILVTTLSRKMGNFIVWFKPEYEQTIHWAGEPNKNITVSENGNDILSPRHSFKLFKQKSAMTSQPWSRDEIRVVTNLKKEIAFAANAKSEALKLLNEQLREAYEELDTFSYTISHDLKNPITAIKLYVQLLLAEGVSTKNFIELLYKIDERANRMNFLINSVLDYARTGRSALKIVKIDMTTLIKEIVSDQVLDHKGMEIIVGDTPVIYGDLVMITQVFSNLISNAIKYSANQLHPCIRINGEVAGNKINYSISDNGIGILAKDLTAIFVLFSRMENVNNIEGSGVGLAIVKRILDKHKAPIHVSSEPGRGSIFTISFQSAASAEL